MKQKFEMSAMGELAFFLGIQVDQKKEGYTPEFQAKPKDSHIKAVKRILHYLKGKTKSWTLTCEADYVTTSSCCSQVLWIQQQMRDYGLKFTTTPIFVDNTAAIAITENPVSHKTTKHINKRHHFIRDYSETIDSIADIFTKAFDSV
ncbi:hypothetical protein E3N88_29289 [Mikania micrantha]|uniref:Reverse transcriptase Ty1/copia-type domain-containing protein n=1 Tax=Mikania micrantha TaxID=192012 RepID=A0A5N6MJ21_9ASTR|nr:hypothetical protein E3N88_29289 [Mikania micrantha]